MDCFANFGSLQADSNCVKHCKKKMVETGGVSVLLGADGGPRGHDRETFSSLDKDEAH